MDPDLLKYAKYLPPLSADIVFIFTVVSAAQRGYVEVARVLLENGADVNFQSSSGKTALMMASFSGGLTVFFFCSLVQSTLVVTDTLGTSVDVCNCILLNLLIPLLF